MSVSLVLALGLGAGLCLAGFGLVAPSLAQQRRLRRHTLQRLGAPRSIIKVNVPAPVALRKADTGLTWKRIFGNTGSTGAQRPVLIYLAAIGVALTVALCATVLTRSWIGLVAGLILPACGWILWVRHRQIQRRNAIDESIPEALDMIVRALRIGFPITMAVQGAARDLSGPLAEEFALTADRVSYGQTLPSALLDLAERCENQNLRFFAAAVSIQSAAGGNLADVLDRLCAVARGRIQMRRKINAITAEAKWSGRFLSAFPLLATAGLLALNPNFYDGVSNQDFFKPLMAIVGVMLLINVGFMRWLSKMD